MRYALAGCVQLGVFREGPPVSGMHDRTSGGVGSRPVRGIEVRTVFENDDDA